LKTKISSSNLKNDLSYYNAGTVVVKSEAVGWAPELEVMFLHPTKNFVSFFFFLKWAEQIFLA
jgi:hypothetical protein